MPQTTKASGGKKGKKTAAPEPTVIGGFEDLGGPIDGLIAQVAALNARVDGVSDAAISAKEEAAAIKEMVDKGLTAKQLDALIERMGDSGVPKKVADGLKSLQSAVKAAEAKAATEASLTTVSGKVDKAVKGAEEATKAAEEATKAAEEATEAAEEATEAALRARGVPVRVWDAYTGLAPASTGWKVVYYAGTGLLALAIGGEIIGAWRGWRWCRVSSFFTEAPLP